MAVQPGPTEKRYAANGVSVSYTVPFLVIEAGDLQVLLNGVQITTGFVHVGIGLPTSSLVFTIPPTGDLFMQLNVPFQRLVDYQENGDFLANTVNRDYDRIWQALKQLLRITTRSPVLGLNDIDGQGFYRAKGNGMTGLASANFVPDAATNWMDVRDYVASILSTGQGPINNAANVVYLYPDNTARTLQTLSSYTDPLLGSRGIGHYKDGVTQWTVDDAIAASDAAIAVNAGNIASNTAAITQLNFDTQLNRAQPLFSRSFNVLNLGHGVNIIGDSISAGAYQGNVYTNGWPALLAKAINNQFGSKNVGAIPMDSLYNPVAAYLTDQLHAVTWFGDWGTRVGSIGIYDWPIGNTGAAAGDAINGKTVVSVNNTAYVEITVPSINRIATFYYVGQPGGGKFDVSVNGAIVSELNTYAPIKTYNMQYPLITVDGGQGETIIRLTKKDTLPTELQPVVRYQKVSGNLNEHFQLMNVCNHSISGRQLVTMTEAGIIAATNCASVVLALGYNDAQADTDDTYYAAYLQRINWFIQYANIFKCLVVVADFCWYASPTGRRRAQLKRVATDTRGLYLGFPDKFYPQGQIPVDTSPAASELISPLNLFADNAHPNFKGNEMIFTQIARALGLTITSRRSALLSDMPFPLKLAGTLKNKTGDLSCVSRIPGGLLYSLGITANGGGSIASGSTPLYTLPAKFYPSAEVRASSCLLALTTAGVINNFVTTLVDGSATGVVINASVIEGSFAVAEKSL